MHAAGPTLALPNASRTGFDASMRSLTRWTSALRPVQAAMYCMTILEVCAGAAFRRDAGDRTDAGASC